MRKWARNFEFTCRGHFSWSDFLYQLTPTYSRKNLCFYSFSSFTSPPRTRCFYKKMIKSWREYYCIYWEDLGKIFQREQKRNEYIEYRCIDLHFESNQLTHLYSNTLLYRNSIFQMFNSKWNVFIWQSEDHIR
jgi:hypothetical protein